MVDTNFKLNFNLVYDYSKGISEFIENHDRNILIAMTVVNDSGFGVRLILSDRVQHLLLLTGILDDKGIKAEILHGSLKQTERFQVLRNIKSGRCHYLLATSQLIGEGFDLAEIESVFMATPVRFSGRLIQFIGRALRSALGKIHAKVYDFIDCNEPVLNSQAESRFKTYESQGFDILTT